VEFSALNPQLFHAPKYCLKASERILRLELVERIMDRPTAGWHNVNLASNGYSAWIVFVVEDRFAAHTASAAPAGEAARDAGRPTIVETLQ
jgi:hypothetical protein